jgi:hypothetical protein
MSTLYQRLREMGFTSLSLKLAPVRTPGVEMFEGWRETITAFAEVLPDIKQLP